ncbi:MAG: hypothetical protein ACK55I_14045, partial [bacterium]
MKTGTRGGGRSLPGNQPAGQGCTVPQAVHGEFWVVGATGTRGAGLVEQAAFATPAHQFDIVLEEVVPDRRRGRQPQFPLNEVARRRATVLEREEAAGQRLRERLDAAERHAA